MTTQNRQKSNAKKNRNSWQLESIFMMTKTPVHKASFQQFQTKSSISFFLVNLKLRIKNFFILIIGHKQQYPIAECSKNNNTKLTHIHISTCRYLLSPHRGKKCIDVSAKIPYYGSIHLYKIY